MKATGYFLIMNAPSFMIIYPQLIAPTLIIMVGLILITHFILIRGNDVRHKYYRR